uniref:Reverse transcriptase domain-containing protein n=1 Tax=Tanacetum cinerariifolium TaxID=118510 RepID=A0A6L2K212_TANCI|nr:reverse transcriptase domain-containing protein [Tanacetum cinerariifolium]
MIKEHDQQAKIKAMPRILAYADSCKKALAMSLARDFSDRLSLESFGTSDTHKQTRFASKSQRTPSKNKELAHLRRSRRLVDQSITKEKVGMERSKPRGKRPRHQETSSDSKHEEEFSQQKRYAKDPTEIHGIKRRQNEGLQAFMDRFKSKSSHIKGVPLVLRMSSFMHGHGHPELAKKFNEKIPKKVDEMFERVRAFIREEVVARSAEMVRPSQEDKANKRSCSLGEVGSPGEGHPSEQPVGRKSRKEQCKGHKHDKRRSQGRNNVKVINMIREEERSGLTDELTFPVIPRNQLTGEPIILEGVIKGS